METSKVTKEYFLINFTWYGCYRNFNEAHLRIPLLMKNCINPYSQFSRYKRNVTNEHEIKIRLFSATRRKWPYIDGVPNSTKNAQNLGKIFIWNQWSSTWSMHFLTVKTWRLHSKISNLTGSKYNTQYWFILRR